MTRTKCPVCLSLFTAPMDEIHRHAHRCNVCSPRNEVVIIEEKSARVQELEKKLQESAQKYFAMGELHKADMLRAKKRLSLLAYLSAQPNRRVMNCLEAWIQGDTICFEDAIRDVMEADPFK